MEIIAITTSSSIKVKAFRGDWFVPRYLIIEIIVLGLPRIALRRFFALMVQTEFKVVDLRCAIDFGC
jgi:hypothetical protein